MRTRTKQRQFRAMYHNLRWFGRISINRTHRRLFRLQRDETPFEREVASLKLHIECFRATSTGLIQPTPARLRSFVISCSPGCHLIGAEEVCKVAEPITTVPIEGSLTLLTKMPDILLRPEAGTLLWTVHVTGAECGDAGAMNLSGEQLCVAPALEEDAVEQLMECAKNGSFLFNGTKPATFELSDIIDLHPPYEGDEWSIIQGS